MPQESPADWYRDPFLRHELRYWDGDQWTEHVSSRGRQDTDAPVSAPPVPTVGEGSKRIQREVRRVGVAASAEAAGATLFTEPVLVVSQKAKLIEVNAEYAVYDQHGRKIGAVREVGHGIARKVIAGSFDHLGTHRLQVVDLNGTLLISLTRPETLLKSKVVVRDAKGAEIGQILQKTLGWIGKVRFDLESGGQPMGSINAEDWNSWDFSIQNASGDEVARVTRTWPGLVKEIFTKVDRYVVQIPQLLDEPLRSLVVASALAIDTVLRQDPNQSRY